MRRIVTAISAAALAFSMVATATPAAAAAGFDSAYAGESAFLSLSPGQSGTFTVFFANTGTTSWVKGSTTQVDLAACLEDKVTCNAQDASEASYNSAWLSATRYATQTQTTVAPGTIGTFTYNVMVPAGGTGLHRFNGALVLASNGSDIHNEGYYQDVNVTGPSAAAAVLVALSPIKGAVEGGTTVTASGTGFVCTPAFPVVTFDTTAGTTTACGATSLTVTTPAHAAGTVNVTVTNAGAPASNALIFTYADTTPPVISKITPTAGTMSVKVDFSESICNSSLFALTDFVVNVNGNPSAVTEIRSTNRGSNLVTSTVGCDTGRGNAAGSSVLSSTSYQLAISTSIIAGDNVTATVNCSAMEAVPGTTDGSQRCAAGGASKIQDLAGNVMAAAMTATGTGIQDTTKPTISSATALSASNLRVTWAEPVLCETPASATPGADAGFLNQFTATVSGTTATPTGATCSGGTTLGAQRITLTFGTDISAGGFITYQESSTSSFRVRDLAGNFAASPLTASFAAVAAATPPTITDAHVTNNTGSTNFGDVGDAFSLTFSEKMSSSTSGVQIQVTDNDPGTNKTLATIACGTNANCVWNTAVTVLTVTMTAGPTIDAIGSTPDLQLPLTIVATTNLKDDDDGVPPNLGAGDKVID